MKRFFKRDEAVKHFVLAWLATCFSLYASSQDINFSQFYELPLLRNPALAGTYRGDVRVTTAFRNQWNSVTVPYRTEALGTELKFGVSRNSNDYLSLGLQVTNDVAGDSKLGKTQVLPVLAFHKSVSNQRDAYLSLGFMGGAVQQRFDQTKLRFDDQFINGAYSATNPTHDVFDRTNLTYWDAGVGMKYSSDFGYENKFYIGAAYFHFTEPKVAFSKANDIRLNRKVVLNAGVSSATSETDRVILYLDYFRQGGNGQAQGGALYKHDLIQEDDDYTISISAGAFIRWNDALIPVIKLDYYNLSIGATYDVNISKLAKASTGRGGFEFTLSYSDFLNIRNSSAEKVRCPVNF
jgi:type IX secretion system PorP/SprF family membrane protein